MQKLFKTGAKTQNHDFGGYQLLDISCRQGPYYQDLGKNLRLPFKFGVIWTTRDQVKSPKSPVADSAEDWLIFYPDSARKESCSRKIQVVSLPVFRIGIGEILIKSERSVKTSEDQNHSAIRSKI